METGQFRMLRCRMAGVTAVVAVTGHTFSRHTHDQFGIGIITHGAQKSLSGRGMVEAGAGDTITVNPGEVHDGAPIGNAGRTWQMLYLDPPLVADALRDMSDGKTAHVEFSHPVMTDSQVARRFQEFFRLLTTAGHETGADEHLFLLLAAAMRPKDAVKVAAIPRAILLAQNRIDDDPSRAITLSDLAQICGLSRFQLLRGFAKATGLTPHAYLVQRRIQLARRLIAQGLSLADAAFASGFADQSHMTRIFTRTYGVSPRIFAASVR